jgi:hypothetical protein
LSLSYLPVPQPEGDCVAAARVSLHDVFALYTQGFWRWFAITAPTSALCALVLFLRDQRVREIYRHISPSTVRYHWGDVAESYIVSLLAFFAAWLLGCFALAAIATEVNGARNEDASPVWMSDSYQRARERFGQISLVALFTFFAFGLCMVPTGIVGAVVIRMVGWPHFARFSLWVSTGSYIVIASVLSWFGMAIPLVLRGSIGAWAAIRKSLKISNGYEGFLFLLVIESLVGSYVAWYAVHYGLALVIPAPLRYSAWYGWTVYITFVLASAAVQPPMFIGFSLLAERNGPSLP